MIVIVIIIIIILITNCIIFYNWPTGLIWQSKKFYTSPVFYFNFPKKLYSFIWSQCIKLFSQLSLTWMQVLLIDSYSLIIILLLLLLSQYIEYFNLKFTQYLLHIVEYSGIVFSSRYKSDLISMFKFDLVVLFWYY